MTDSRSLEAPDEMPLEPWTALRAVTRRRWSAVLLAVVVLPTAFVATRALVPERYAAETVLVHTPSAREDAPGATEPSLESRKEMVKVLPNLQEVIKRRHLEVTPLRLERAIEPRVERDSRVLVIHAEWSDPQVAADIANDLADVFLTQQTGIRRTSMTRVIADLERQQARAQAALHDAADALGRFRQDHGVVNIDDQIRASLLEVSTLEGQLNDAGNERHNLELQRKNLSTVVRNVSQKLSDGQVGTTLGTTPEEQAQHLARLRTNIEEERRAHERQAVLGTASVEVARMRRLQGMGLVSALDVAKAESEYRRATVVASETPQMHGWQQQAAAIDHSLSSSARPGSASAALSPEVAMRAFQIEIDGLAIDDRVHALQATLDRSRAKLAAYPGLQRSLSDLQARTGQLERELVSLEEPLARARRAAASDSPEFVVVSSALPLASPSSSRRMIASVVLPLGFLGLCLAVLGLREVGRRSIRSGRELAFESGLPVYAQTTRAPRPRGPVASLERLKSGMPRMAALSRRLQSGSERRTRRVLITGSISAAARQAASDALFAQMVLEGSRVAWVSLVQDHVNGTTAPQLQMAAHPTLHEYLRSESLMSDGLLDSREAAEVARIGGTAPVPAHLRGSVRLRELLRRADERFDVVVVVGESLVDSPDEAALARECDTVLMLAQAGTTTRYEAKRLSSLVKELRVPRAGWLLLDVDPDFADLEAERTW